MGRIRGVLQRATPAAIFALGAGTLIVHCYHFLAEGELSEILTGVLPPAVISVALVGVSLCLYRSTLNDAYYPRILAWVVGGAVGLAALGSALMVYQISHGGNLYDPEFVVINWVTTGALAGFFVGYYDANHKRAQTRLTEQRDELAARGEKLERHVDRLERLTEIVSHDLRNPLNVAEGHVELAQETGNDGHLDRVADAHRRMDDIIEDTLAMIREGQTVDEIDTTTVELAAVAGESWTNVETSGARLDIEDDCTFRGDESRLRHVFENLFRNAVEHSSASDRLEAADAVEHGPANSEPAIDGQGRDSGPLSPARVDSRESGGGVTVRVGFLPDGFYVEDDGPGLPPDKPVFETGYTTSDTGTGLGLSIVEEIITAHGWEIDAGEGREGGARFEITGVEGIE